MTQETNKPVVYFTGEVTFDEYGGRAVAFVDAIDHPTCGSIPVQTSAVQKRNDDGSFETLNTIYKPQPVADVDTSEERVHISDKNEHVRRYDPTEAECLTRLEVARWNELKARLMQEEFIDEDGYPTDAALELVQKWHWTDCAGLLEFIKDIWHLRSWGWTEVDAKDLDKDDDDYDAEGGKLYFISTAGWSGNESIIAALKQNSMAWMLTWVESRKGGHYIFAHHEFRDDE